MARKGTIQKRKVVPDPIYNDRMVTKLINRSMRDGKKNAAAKEVYKALGMVGEKVGKSGLEVFLSAVENVKPTMEVRARRIGGAAYQVPAVVRGVRREALAIRWLIQAALARSSSEYRSFADKLAAELVEAYNNAGGAIKKKEDMHRMAEANKAFAHFRW